MLKQETKKSFFGRLWRLLHLKLVIPLKRSEHPPEFIARGVLVGMMWAMTPLVGIQMTTVLLTWILCKKFFKWGFSLPVAIAYTWVTNVLTMWPIYYVFYATGKLMMGDLNISAFHAFVQAGREAFSTSVSFWEITRAVLVFLKILMEDWGLAMAIGCIPWSVLAGWLSYRWTKRWLVGRQRNKEKAKERRAYWRALLHKGEKNGNS